jgi:CHAT domain-containing protein
VTALPSLLRTVFHVVLLLIGALSLPTATICAQESVAPRTPEQEKQEWASYAAFLDRGDADSAQAVVRRIRTSAVARGDTRVQIACEQALAYLAARRGVYGESETHLRAVMSLARSIEDADAEADAAEKIGIHYLDTDDPARRAEAEALLARAYGLFRRGSRYSRAVVDDKLADQLERIGVSWHVGNIRDYYRSLVTGEIDYRRASLDPLAASEEIAYGAQLRERGYAARAVLVHTTSRRIWQSLLKTPPPDMPVDSLRWRVAWNTFHLGRDYADLRRWKEALNCFDSARQQLSALGFRRADDEYAEAVGRVYLERGDYPAARKAFLRMKDLRLRMSTSLDPASRALCHPTRDVTWGDYWLGVTARRSGDLAEAERLLFRAHAAFLINGPERGNALAAREIAHVYRDRGRLREARQWYERARHRLAQIHNIRDWIAVEQDIGQVSEAMGERTDAAEAYEAATRCAEWVARRDQDILGTAPAFDARFGPLYADRARFLATTPRPGVSATEAAWEALAVIEQGRSVYLRMLAADVGGGRRWDAARLAPEDAALLTIVRKQRAEAGRRLIAAMTAPRSKTANAERATAIARADVEDASSRLLILREYLFGRYEDLRYNAILPPSTSDDLRTLARRNPDTLYLSWAYVDDRRSLLVTLSANRGARLFPLPVGETRLRTMVQRWRRALTTNTITGSAEEKEAARALYNALLARAEAAGELSGTQYRRLVVIGDGPLRDVSFAALCDSQGRRLVERWAVSTALSLSSLCWPTGARSAHGKVISLFCAADPLGSSAAGASVKASRKNTDRSLPLPPLRHARAEAEYLRRAFPAARILVGKEATEASFRRDPRRKEYALLHFATHGITAPDNGLHSWLLLANEPGDDSEDGRLEAWEIAEMSISARLAVLSACDTGRVRTESGDGLVGFAWAFRAAGCPSVVASLWSVDDAATADLIRRFYEELRRGARKDDALRRAMLAVRAVPRTRRPAFWTAFQIIGDTTPVFTSGSPTMFRPISEDNLG